MAEDKIETYVLTIENGVDSTMITSVKKGNEELTMPDDGINLDNADAASNALKNVLNPAAEAAADIIPPPAPVADADDIDITLTNKKNNVIFKGNVSTLLNQIESSNRIKDKEILKGYIIRTINNPGIDNKNYLINRRFKRMNNVEFNNNVLLGGTHHTRKRTHKPRNTKSNTRKGHIYRTNHRRTHGKSSAHGKKQTRRIANR